MATLRSLKGQAAYDAHRAVLPPDRPCPLCVEVPIATFTHWKIIPNRFPYDRIAQTHHMLVAHEHCGEDNLSDDAHKELTELKRTYCNGHYDHVIEPLPHRKSISEHFHLHLIVVKEF